MTEYMQLAQDLDLDNGLVYDLEHGGRRIAGATHHADGTVELRYSDGSRRTVLALTVLHLRRLP